MADIRESARVARWHRGHGQRADENERAHAHAYELSHLAMLMGMFVCVFVNVGWRFFVLHYNLLVLRASAAALYQDYQL